MCFNRDMEATPTNERTPTMKQCIHSDHTHGIGASDLPCRTGTPEDATHLMRTASSVACGQRMGHWKNNPTGWDLGNATSDTTQVTCRACLATFSRSAR